MCSCFTLSYSLFLIKGKIYKFFTDILRYNILCKSAAIVWVNFDKPKIISIRNLFTIYLFFFNSSHCPMPGNTKTLISWEQLFIYLSIYSTCILVYKSFIFNTFSSIKLPKSCCFFNLLQNSGQINKNNSKKK